MRRFEKPPLTPEQQLDLQIARGLHVANRERALRLLEVTTSFRLSPYMRPFQRHGDPQHRFVPGSRLADIVQLYRFDSDLRQLVMTAIERVEVAARACISNHLAPKYGTHWYLEARQFRRRYRHDRLLAELNDKLESERQKYDTEVRRIDAANTDDETKAARRENRKRDNYARFYALTYSDPRHLPSWAMLEELSFGAPRIYSTAWLETVTRKP